LEGSAHLSRQFIEKLTDNAVIKLARVLREDLPGENGNRLAVACGFKAGERALGAAFGKGGAERVTRLYLRDDLPEDQCWLRAPGWCLAYR
jgi:hypothetical protein